MKHPASVVVSQWCRLVSGPSGVPVGECEADTALIAPYGSTAS